MIYVYMLALLAVWAFMGWIGARAILLYSRRNFGPNQSWEYALATLCAVFGPSCYLASWVYCPSEMKELHTLPIGVEK